MKKGYKSNQWFTFKQAQELGGMVRKGERGEQICYFQMIEKDGKNGEKDKFPMLKLFTVFNTEQIDNLPEKFNISDVEIDTGTKPIEFMEKFVKDTGAIVVTKGNQPCYIPSLDQIEMPAVNQFELAEVLLRNIVSRIDPLDRTSSRLDRFGKNSKHDYAFEELVAELGACFVTDSLGIDKGIDDYYGIHRVVAESPEKRQKIYFSSSNESARCRFLPFEMKRKVWVRNTTLFLLTNIIDV